MSLLDELSWRGFVHQVTHPELGAELERFLADHTRRHRDDGPPG